MSTDSIISKVWGFCTTLRDDGVGYGDYLEQLTYLIFLKMENWVRLQLCDKIKRFDCGSNNDNAYQPSCRCQLSKIKLQGPRPPAAGFAARGGSLGKLLR
jgi:hypothetical protein